MFTGIIEEMGVVDSVDETATGSRVVVRTTFDPLPLGASIAVNGVCLTSVDSDAETFSLDVIPETLRRTNLGELSAGSRVNLERAMPANGRFDGHIVQGHVDGLGTIEALDEREDGSVSLTVRVAESLAPYIVEKGSITIDGVSLTLVDVDADMFTVALIPHTLAITTLGLRKPGDTVNLEADVLAKYVERLLSRE